MGDVARDVIEGGIGRMRADIALLERLRDEVDGSVVERAAEMLGPDNAGRWLVTPLRALGGIPAVILLEEGAEGRRRVETLLAQIESGAYV